ncbi:MAG: LacI family DNA-binding transcriptional regulator [Clostridia bacterium]
MNTKRFTLKDVAQEAGVAISTANAALTGKGRISEKKKQEILVVAQRLGYKVNRVAQSLARKQINIAILMPVDWTDYYGKIEQGIEAELKLLADYNVVGIVKKIKYSACLPAELEECKKEFLRERIDALIVCPAIGIENLNSLILDFLKEDILILAVNTDLVIDNQISFPTIKIDGPLSGKMAAEFLDDLLPDGNKVLCCLGDKKTLVQNEKVIGFMEFIQQQTKLLALEPIETGDMDDQAEEEIAKVFAREPEIRGIYVATGIVKGICSYLDKNGLGEKVKVICSDYSDEIENYMRKKIINATFFQNPGIQGRIAIRTIYDCLLNGKDIKPKTLLMPQLFLRSNILHGYVREDYQQVLYSNE